MTPMRIVIALAIGLGTVRFAQAGTATALLGWNRDGSAALLFSIAGRGRVFYSIASATDVAPFELTGEADDCKHTAGELRAALRKAHFDGVAVDTARCREALPIVVHVRAATRRRVERSWISLPAFRGGSDLDDAGMRARDAVVANPDCGDLYGVTMSPDVDVSAISARMLLVFAACPFEPNDPRVYVVAPSAGTLDWTVRL